MFKFLIGAAAGLLVFTSFGCASKATKTAELDRQIKAEPQISSPEEIARRAAEILSNAPGITFEQRLQLSNIYTKAYLENYEIRTQIGQTMSLLFKIIAKKNYKSSEVALLKSKIKELDTLRLKKAFQALDDVQAVVGYGIEKENTYKYFEYYDFPNPVYPTTNSIMR